MDGKRTIRGWITINGRHIPLMDNSWRAELNKMHIKEHIDKKFDKLPLKEKQRVRFEQLKRKYKDSGEYQKANNVERIELELNAPYPQSGRRLSGQQTTQTELNNLPVRFTVYGQNSRSSYVYKNRFDFEKDVSRSYGGIKQIVGTGKDKLRYSVSSESGLGEFYCERDRYTKGGWIWKDVNGYTVKGRESKTFNTEARKRHIREKLEKKYGKSD